MTELFLGLAAGFAFGSIFTYCWWSGEIKKGRIIGNAELILNPAQIIVDDKIEQEEILSCPWCCETPKVDKYSNNPHIALSCCGKGFYEELISCKEESREFNAAVYYSARKKLIEKWNKRGKDAV